MAQNNSAGGATGGGASSSASGVTSSGESAGGNTGQTGNSSGASEGNSGNGEASGAGQGESAESGEDSGAANQNQPGSVIITGDGAVSAAQTGQNLGNVSSEAIKAGIEACGDDPSKSDAKALLAAELSRRERIDELKGNAEAAESELSAAVKEYVKARDKFEKLKEIPEGATLEEKKEIIRKRNKAASEMYVKKQEMNKKEAECREAYKNLYEAYNQAGDPVQISSGKFMADYIDYESYSQIFPFTIKRSLKNNGKNESFGRNWSSSLDSRIIRCRESSNKSLISDFKKSLKMHEEDLQDLIEFRNKYKGQKDPVVDEWFDNYHAIIKLEKKYIEEFEEKDSNSGVIDSFNEKVSYGIFDTLDSRVGKSGDIIYLDDDGNQHLFKFMGDYYQPYDDYTTFKIYPCKVQSDENANFIEKILNKLKLSYRVEFEDGSKRFYSEYGILERECDRFGNEIIYTCGNSGRIEKIDLPGSEEITISRSASGLITAIENNLGEKITYSYENYKLTGIYYNKKLYQSYSYDGGGDLVKISKSDASCVKIEYALGPWQGKKVCKVTDENGNVETFTYSSNSMTHKTVSGSSEIYRFNSAGNTVYKKDSLGREHIFSNYPDGRVKKLQIGKDWKEYFYDSKGRVTSIRYSNGGQETYSYNSGGFITKHTDADGFSREYKYDSKNNLLGSYFNGKLITSCSYNEKGLLTGLEEAGNKYSYYYDDFFWKVNKIVWTDCKGKVRTQRIKYNSKGQIESFCDYEGNVFNYVYKDNYKCETGSRMKIETYYDDYQNVMKVVESDLVNNITYSKSYVRDNKGNVIELYLNGSLYGQYEYNSLNQMKSKVVWNNLGEEEYFTGRQGIRSEYDYDSRGLLLGVKKSIVHAEKENDGKGNSLSGGEITEKRVTYYIDSSGITVKEYVRDMTTPYVYKYDNNERLMSRSNPDGYTVNYVYSKAGRVNELLDSNENLTKFDYFSDGSCEKLLRDSESNSCKWTYDKNMNLISFLDFEKNNYSYSYDWKGSLIEEKGPGWKVIYELDSKNRVLSEKKYDSGGKLFYLKTNNYDDKNLNTKVTENNKYVSENHYDVWGRLLWTENRAGRREYSYDVLGNQIERCDESGQVYDFEYTPGGKVSLIKSSGGEVIRQVFNAAEECIMKSKDDRILYRAEYGKAGLIEKVVDEFGNESKYSYDSRNLLSSLEKNDTGLKSYVFDENNRTFGILENGKKLYEYKIGSKDKIESLRNPFGDLEENSYDKNGNLKFKKYFSGLTKSIDFDSISNEETVGYSNGEEIKITYDFNQKITSLASGAVEFNYTYDDLGQMIKCQSTNYDLPLDYEYDVKGNCVRKKSEVFDYSYVYDERGNILKVREGISGAEINFRYDERNREIERIYSNGIKCQQGYSEKDQKIWTLVFDKNGRVIDGDFVLYDALGKVRAICNTEGQVTRYTYDSKGHLVKSEVPYSDALRDFYYEEALLCGLNIKNREVSGERIQLSNEEWKGLNSIIQAASVNNEVRVDLRQNFWVEKYDYTENGSVKFAENQYGRINYYYDQMNRLIAKSGSSRENGLVLNWDKDCNLCEISSERIRVKMSYKEEGKLTSVFVGRLVEENGFFKWKSECVEFKYDALGRPVEELSVNGFNFKYIYDGLSNELLYKVAVNDNNVSLLEYSAEYENFCGELGKSLVISQEGDLQGYRDSNGESQEALVRTVDLTEFATSDDFRQLVNAENSLADDYKLEDEVLFYSQSKENILSKSILYLGGKAAFAIDNIKSGNNSISMDCFYTNKLDQIVSVFDENGKRKSSVFYDCWGNSIGQSEYNYYSGGFSLNLLGFEIYRLGSRSYIPALNTFTSVDPIKDGGNWFAYCPTDPVNYRDASGFYKEGTSEAQNIKYAEKLLDFLDFSTDRQKKNKIDKGIPLYYDCADTTAAIDNICAAEAGMDDYSDMAEAFDEHYHSENNYKAKDHTCSKDYYDTVESKKGKTARKTSGNREDLTNPEYVTPGTVLVLTHSSFNEGNYPDCKYRGKTDSGHTIIVISREMDKDGNIVGLVYLEGHTDEETPGEMSYMYVNGTDQCWLGLFNFNHWAGHYDGTYEIENDDHASKVKTTNICTTR